MFSSGYHSTYGRFVSIYYSIPQGAVSEKIIQSMDNGITWEDAYIPNDIWVFTYNGVPMHMTNVAQLEQGKTYQFRVVVTGGENQGNSNIVTHEVR